MSIQMTEREIDAMNGLAWELRDDDTKRAFELSKAAYDLSHNGRCETTPYLKGQAHSLSLLGYLSHYRADYDAALSQSLEALELFEQIDQSTGVPSTLTIIGLTYLRLGSYAKAAPYHHKALKIARGINDAFGEAKALNAIGLTYLWRDCHKEVLAYFSESLQIYQRIGDTNGQCAVMTNLCMSYRELSDYKNALAYGTACLRICQETGNKNREAMALSNIGITYAKIGNYKEALFYFNQSLETIKYIDDKFVKVSILLNVGKLYYKTSTYRLSQDYLHQALDIAEESDQKGFQFECHHFLAKSYKAQDRFEIALEHYEQFHAIRELVFKEESENQLKNLELVHYTETARKEDEIDHLEKQLRQTQKLEAIGTLAGGIAHDFNNILGAIMGYTQLATIDLPTHSEPAQHLQEVLAACFRAKDLVQQILTFSRQTEHENQPIHLAPVINEALKLLRASLPSTIELRQDISQADMRITSNPTQIHQVIMNLCTNAAHAMRVDGGVMSVCAEPALIDAAFATRHPSLRPGPYVRLRIRDTGHGIAQEGLERLFEPFYTTKEAGEGTGMGLAVVHGIVAGHSGIIDVESTVGEGTTFTIYFPRTTEITEEESISEAPLLQGQGRILFVDDEQVLVRLGCAMLKRLGYETVAHTRSFDALHAFRASPQDYDLVITDQTMPQMTGITLSRELRRIRPDIPIILCTGLGHDINEDAARRLGINGFLMKPLTMQDVSTTVQYVLS